MIRPPEKNWPSDFSNERMYLEVTATSIHHLPDDCMLAIFQLLSSREILAMEQVSQHHRARPYIRNSWKWLCNNKKITIEWSNLFEEEDDPYPEKFTYRTEMALQYFLNDRRKLAKHAEKQHFNNHSGKCHLNNCLKANAIKIYKCFQTVINWNPYLNKYIRDDLSKIVSWDFYISLDNSELFYNFDLPPDKLKESFFSFALNYQSNYLSHFGHLIKPGLLLLDGLSFLADYQSHCYKNGNHELSYFFREHLFSAYNFLRLAMIKGVSHASLLARKIIANHQTDDMEEVIINLAMFSAYQKDYRALEKYFLKNIRLKRIEVMINDIDTLTENYKEQFPPMFIFRAASMIYQSEEEIVSEELEKAESFFKQGIECYQQDKRPIPAEVWLIGAAIKQRLGKVIEVDACINESMLVLAENISDENGKFRVEIKEKLSNIEKAIIFFKHASKLLSNRVTEKN